MSVKITNNADKLLKAYEEAARKALTEIGLVWLKEVTEIVNTGFGRPIVVTGRYRASFKYDIDFGSKTINLGPTVNYAKVIEFGARGRGRRPVLTRSIMDFIPLYESIIKEHLGSAWSVVIK